MPIPNPRRRRLKKDKTMRKIAIFTEIVFILLLISACSSLPKADEKVKQAPEDVVDSGLETEPDKESRGGEDKEEEEDAGAKDQDAEEDDSEKDKNKATEKTRDKKEDNRYDGLKYIGPAQDKFIEGIGKYFADGCRSAIESWSEAALADKKNHVVAYNIALCYQRLKDFDKSKSWYEKAYNLNPEFTKPLYNLVLMVGEKIKSEKDYFLKLVGKTEDIVEKNNFISWLFLQTGELESAEKYAKLVLKEDEQNADAVISLATVYYKNKMFRLAESALETAEKWDDENFRLHRLFGFITYEMGNKSKAGTHFQKALKLNPELVDVKNILAVLAMEIEDYASAKEHLEFALKVMPDFKPALLNLSVALVGLGEHKQAKEILLGMAADDALSQDMKNRVFFNIAIFHLDNDMDGDGTPKRFDIAIEYFNKYLKGVTTNKAVKDEKKLVDGYIKEAVSEKSRLERTLKMKARAEKKEMEKEKEHQQFLANKEKAFENAIQEDSKEVWEQFLKDYPVIDENDKMSLAATARFLKLSEENKANNEKMEEVKEKNDTIQSED